MRTVPIERSEPSRSPVLRFGRIEPLAGAWYAAVFDALRANTVEAVMEFSLDDVAAEY